MYRAGSTAYLTGSNGSNGGAGDIELDHLDGGSEPSSPDHLEAQKTAASSKQQRLPQNASSGHPWALLSCRIRRYSLLHATAGC